MVVSRDYRPLLFIVLLLIPLLEPSAQNRTPAAERTRIGLGAVTTGDVLAADGSRLRGSATNILGNAHPEALYFDAPGAAFVSDGEADLSKADAAQFDLFLLLRVAERDDQEGYDVALELYDVRGRERLTTIRTVSQIDRIGRYLRSSTWDVAVARLSPFIEAYRPLSELTIRTTPGARILVSGRQEPMVADEEGAARTRLRNMRSYSVRVEKPGHRSRESSLFLGREPGKMSIPLRRYPVWAVALTLKEAGFPGFSFGRYLAETSLFVELTGTTHLFGFTPLRQLGRQFADDPGLVTTIPSTEFGIGAEMLLRSRDRLFRPYFGISGFTTLIHADYYTGIDPILPAGANLSLGAAQEVAERLYVTVEIQSRAQYIVDRSLLVPYPFFYTIGSAPVAWQPATLHLGVRFGL